MDRGKMYNEKLFKQGQDFSGLRWDNITPTDVDGLVDFQNNMWIIFQLKHRGNDMPYGQRLAYQRLTDDLGKIKPCIFFLAEHLQPAQEAINAKNAIVIEYRYAGQWIKTDKGLTLK